MLGDNLHPKNNLSQQLFADWLNPNTGRRSRSQSRALIEEYKNSDSLGTGLIEKIINVSDVKIEEDF
jgi:hypothetical protein